MNKKDELANRAASLTDRQPARKQPGDTPAPPRNAPRAKPIRITTDLAPQTYRFLITYAAELALQTGHAKIAHSEITRALLIALEQDPDLRKQISAHVIAQISK